ncbi:MAG: hypothetical protein BWY09_01880 [Candidatus Hydrogenedentes bacterium ADurb.Bin179]|nr:MAG: hypothetical protein BWY09_01880 [Candidatus Hydrogenedentes bacterium ADurb.Bin179]
MYPDMHFHFRAFLGQAIGEHQEGAVIRHNRFNDRADRTVFDNPQRRQGHVQFQPRKGCTRFRRHQGETACHLTVVLFEHAPGVFIVAHDQRRKGVRLQYFPAVYAEPVHQPCFRIDQHFKCRCFKVQTFPHRFQPGYGLFGLLPGGAIDTADLRRRQGCPEYASLAPFKRDVAGLFFHLAENRNPVHNGVEINEYGFVVTVRKIEFAGDYRVHGVGVGIIDQYGNRIPLRLGLSCCMGKKRPCFKARQQFQSVVHQAQARIFHCLNGRTRKYIVKFGFHQVALCLV